MSSVACITFRLGGERYALPVTQVREIVELEHLSPLPEAPAHMLGLINLRGIPVPVMDLRARFSLPAPPPVQGARILILENTGGGKLQLIGGLADAVEEVVELAPARLPEAPASPLRKAASLVDFVALHRGTFTLLLNLEAVFRGEQALPPALPSLQQAREGICP